VVHQAPVHGHDVGRDIEVAVVAHDRVQHPEEAPRLGLRLALELLRYLSDRLERRGAGYVARKHHVEVVEVGLLQALVEVGDLLRRHFRARPLSVSGVVACSRRVRTRSQSAPGGREVGNVLNCTVFSAATSHPSDWRLKTAILLPT
jgi:hypothetical protein